MKRGWGYLVRGEGKGYIQKKELGIRGIGERERFRFSKEGGEGGVVVWQPCLHPSACLRSAACQGGGLWCLPGTPREYALDAALT